MARFIFVAQFAATWTMFGIIWFVQIVHYPLFDGVGEREFTAYERRHSRLTSFVVGPPMLVELLCAFAALRPVWRVSTMSDFWAWIGVALVCVIWLSTAILQVPRHSLLESRFDAAVQRSLVATNWIRTASWSLRAALLLAIAVKGLRP
jgi:hypothetical protein